MSSASEIGEGCGSGGTYRSFAEYAWNKLSDGDDGLIEETTVPAHLASNSSPIPPARGGGQVKIEIKSASSTSTEHGNCDENKSSSLSPLRLARYALLETLNDENQSVPTGIQVLNLVLFPSSSLPLPVLGMDLVTLPGDKHLIAIDFQPILPPASSSEGEGESGSGSGVLFVDTEQYDYSKWEERLKEVYTKHVVEQEVLPWGGDIPPAASRFFSPYALWTRLSGSDDCDALSIIQKEVFAAFCDYLDLYLEMMNEVKNDGGGNGNGSKSDEVLLVEACTQGHKDYLDYRMTNDPARPMLKRLYGDEYTEDVISNVLFQMI
eukprot:CAMPEP_0194090544 /NCGR_PEP_ID=MMETSP0149-20130528/39497_1 /TAXON_ID=122233 /ORGANISM="Chaetoceros debilis, Strain MM31A-1" /LENGTH=321 /DNA_ID=CAMNT_0038774835 /DNA_START=224 /DNA_END=1189 /DNA_ORIENTATION=-